MNINPITIIESDLIDLLPLDAEHALPLCCLADVMNTKQITIAFLLISLKAKEVPIACITENRKKSFFIATDREEPQARGDPSKIR